MVSPISREMNVFNTFLNASDNQDIDDVVVRNNPRPTLGPAWCRLGRNLNSNPFSMRDSFS